MQNGTLGFPYLENLNPAQREAVELLDGPLLVLAGAGTGKTRVLTARLAHLLATGRARPHQILAVTFTNKAAQEMRTRVSALLDGVAVEGWWLGTFHSLAARMLRRHAERVGLTSDFTILDPDDQQRLIKQLLEAQNIDSKRWPPRAVAALIDRWKDRALTPDKISAADAGDFAGGKMLSLYRDYQNRLRTLNACDFGDLLLHMITIFRDPVHIEALTQFQERFRYILVDEYQDTNLAQYQWLRLLAQKNRNICCVGDDDQSIYGWRGAEIGNILRFETDFPGAKIVRLEQNYRSTNHILSAADRVIAHNKGRLGKTLWSAQGDGEKLELHGLWDGQQEARFVGDKIESLQRKQISLKEIAILVRTGFQTREFEECFIYMGLPYRVIGGQRFYERREVRDALAYLRLIVQPRDDLAFERIINLPKRGIGASTLQKLHETARTKNIALTEAVELADGLRPAVRATLHALMEDFARWRGMLSTQEHTDVARIVLDESGYTAMWKQDKNPDAPGRLENLKELVSAIGEFGSLQDFLEHVALVMENQENSSGDMISIMTLHGAKGLEFDNVFLPGWEEGLFPSQRTMDENGLAGLEEERRLAYVALTRARKLIFISHAASRLLYGSWVSALPSRFIAELPAEHVEIFAQTGLSSGHMAAKSSDPTIRAVAAASPRRSAGGFEEGARVYHQSFGAGTVLSVDQDKLDIRFDKAGRKKIMERFVTAEREIQ